MLECSAKLWSWVTSGCVRILVPSNSLLLRFCDEGEVPQISQPAAKSTLSICICKFFLKSNLKLSLEIRELQESAAGLESSRAGHRGYKIFLQPWQRLGEWNLWGVPVPKCFPDLIPWEHLTGRPGKMALKG